jgi:hypothetical protein
MSVPVRKKEMTMPEKEPLAVIEFHRTMTAVSVSIEYRGGDDPLIYISQVDDLDGEAVEIKLHPEQLPLLVDWLTAAADAVLNSLPPTDQALNE